MLRKWGLKKLVLMGEVVAYVFLFTLIAFMILLNVVAVAEMIGRFEVQLENMGATNTSKSSLDQIKERLRY